MRVRVGQGKSGEKYQTVLKCRHGEAVQGATTQTSPRVNLMVLPGEQGQYKIRRFKPSFEAVGIVVDFLSREAPFDRFGAGPLVTALKYQIVNGHHVSAFRGEALIGYCGWLRINHADGELWLADKADLTPLAGDRADAVALTIVRVDEPAAVRPLIRACRILEPRKRVFFKRDYAQATHAARRNTVMNISPRGTGG
jgi:hypothetical protein